MDLHDLISKSRDGEPLSRGELIYLLSLPPDSSESLLVMAQANRISKDLTGNKAEVHAQLALNLGPCPLNCIFCAFAQKNGVFTEEKRLSMFRSQSDPARWGEFPAAAMMFHRHDVAAAKSLQQRRGLVHQ